MEKDSAFETAKFIETEIDGGCQGPGVEVAQEDASDGVHAPAVQPGLALTCITVVQIL